MGCFRDRKKLEAAPALLLVACLSAGAQEAPKPRDGSGGGAEAIEAIKDDAMARRAWFARWFGPISNDYLDYRTRLGEREIARWGRQIPGTAAYIRSKSTAMAGGPGDPGVRLAPKAWVDIGPWLGHTQVQSNVVDANICDTGRPTAILLHPTDPNTVYVGFAGGGLWRSANAAQETDADWVWDPLTDGLPAGGNISIGAAAFKHDDPQTLYISLGDMMSGSAPEGTAEGRGFYVSTDGGATWVRGGELGKSNRTKTVLSLPGNIVLVAGNMGLFRSTDGGAAFTRVQSGPLQDGSGVSYAGAPYPPNEYAAAWDIVRLSGSGRLVLTYQFCDGGADYEGTKGSGYGAYGGGGIAWSEDNGATWTKAAVAAGTAAVPARGFGRIAIAASGDTLYGLYQVGDVPDPTGAFSRILLKSVDGGKTWVTNSTGNEIYSVSNDGGQAGYNHMVAVDPDDPNTVFIGTNMSLWRSTNGGTAFSQFSSWLANGRQYTHADMHLGVWGSPANGRPKALYMATDGGLSIVRRPGGAIQTGSGQLPSDPTIIDHRRNRKIATHLVYSFGNTNASAPAGSKDRIIAGFQDLGTRLRRTEGVIGQTYDYVIGGDGFGCLIHPYNGDLMLGSIYYCQIRRSTNGGGTFSSSTSGISGAGDEDRSPFFTRLIQGMADPSGNQVYTFTDTVPYRSSNFGQSWTAMATTSGSGWPGGDIRGMGASPIVQGLVGVTFDVSVDLGGGNYSRGRVAISNDNGLTWRVFTGFPGCRNRMADIAFDSSDPNIMYVHSVTAGNWNVSMPYTGYAANHIWKSTDGGYTWAAIDGSATLDNGFPFGIPVHAVKVDPLNNNMVYAGTDFGLYWTQDRGASWARFGTGLPMVSVRDVYIAPDGSFMRVATHGRGVWEMEGITENYAPVITANPQNATVDQGRQATFLAAAVGIPAPTLQWQVSANGTSWTNIPGANANTYTQYFGMADNGRRFRLSASNTMGTAAGSQATLTVNLNCDIDGATGLDVYDVLKLMSLHGSTAAADVALGDFNGDGRVDNQDLAIVLGKF